MDPIFTEDVRPVTDLKVRGAAIVEQVRRTRRPVLITRRGRGVAVLLDLEEFERMREALEFGRAVDEGAAAAARGDFADEREVEAVLGARGRKR
ncbi:MAG: type II toxin-antitoxin system Phd/YefM family antitoxin [Myxococcales bacterium]